ncbi:hypothetical protein E8L90_06580 [Brevibacillus antibioticus]|uniref:Uncharacterized protein n=1 Tax=Brevibacillus antibioticus TaxID=2570228 RepID=A0A4U2Y7E1_9BACL|nr:hypothetical protein [Brevibacillus antibioticus]TKI55141.1 hypothetical protein E8L90_06580 [Brevibacillus antibioticus]
MTYNLKDAGERGIPQSLDLGERPKILFTGPEWKMEDGMKLDDGPVWAMKTSGPDSELNVSDPDWVMNLDDGPGWQLYGPPDGWEKTLQCGPVETGTVVLH